MFEAIGTRYLKSLRDVLAPYPWAYDMVVVCLLLFAAWLANWITKRVLLRGLRRMMQALPLAADDPQGGVQFKVIPRLANVIPALVLSIGVSAVPHLPSAMVGVVRNVCAAFIVLTVAWAASRALDLINQIYERRPDANSRPIKGYLQLLKIVVFVIAAVLMVSVLIGKSPLILLSGVGAIMAVLILVFQDTLLSLVASVTIGSNDMVRVGDWIEMPQQNVDGEVIDIALHTVKVQNWDKTISTIPTKKLISDSFKNWRGMQESGGRRIRRALYLDQQSIRFLDETMIERLGTQGFICGDINGSRGKSMGQPAGAARTGLINAGAFRAYAEAYLREHPGTHKGMTLMVRQLAPTSLGLPVELYCFTRTTEWGEYETIQSDIFDHLIAVLPMFGLRLYQQASDMMLMQALDRPSPILPMTTAYTEH